MLLSASLLLSGCISDVWTGVGLVYDRHNIYKKLSDYQLAANASRALFNEQTFKREDCAIDLAIFNRDVLMAGHVPTEALRQEAQSRVAAVSGYRRLFNQLAVIENPIDNALEDNWITAKIRSGIFADSEIDPKQFKVVTADKIVYLMGDVLPEQAERVIQLARECTGVRRVVKLFKYFNLSDKPEDKKRPESTQAS